MVKHRIKSLMIVPPHMKCLEYVNQLWLFESVEMSDYGVKLTNHIIFLLPEERSAIDTDRRCPSRKSLVRTG